MRTAVTPDKDTFETQLAKEMVKAERQRITVVALVGAIATIYVLVLVLVFPELAGMTIAEEDRSLAFFLIPWPFVALVVYALLLRRRSVAALT